MSLEVDQPGIETVTHFNEHHNGKEAFHGPVVYQSPNIEVPLSTSRAQQSAHKSRSVPALLVAALVVMTILAIVTAAVGGSTASRRESTIKSLRQQLDANNKVLTDQPCVSQNTSLPSPQPVKLSEIRPSSNCSEIGDKKTYVSALYKVPFTVQCEKDYTGSDTLGIWMFTFADCMEACASWNFHQNSPPCYAVSYDPSDAFTEAYGGGNCFLKGRKNIQAYSKAVTSSADAQLSGDW